jgi:hypothetical protein
MQSRIEGRRMKDAAGSITYIMRDDDELGLLGLDEVRDVV